MTAEGGWLENLERKEPRRAWGLNQKGRFWWRLVYRKIWRLESWEIDRELCKGGKVAAAIEVEIYHCCHSSPPSLSTGLHRRYFSQNSCQVWIFPVVNAWCVFDECMDNSLGVLGSVLLWIWDDFGLGSMADRHDKLAQQRKVENFFLYCLICMTFGFVLSPCGMFSGSAWSL